MCVISACVSPCVQALLIPHLLPADVDCLSLVECTHHHLPLSIPHLIPPLFHLLHCPLNCPLRALLSHKLFLAQCDHCKQGVTCAFISNVRRILCNGVASQWTRLHLFEISLLCVMPGGTHLLRHYILQAFSIAWILVWLSDRSDSTWPHPRSRGDFRTRPGLPCIFPTTREKIPLARPYRPH